METNLTTEMKKLYDESTDGNLSCNKVEEVLKNFVKNLKIKIPIIHHSIINEHAGEDFK